ncbi:MAG: D-aminoacylase [Candidatus Eremiobacteraeota bacterium]|nr:D-aminoacylase [Candidatus Eremiobacteraeota bacterium]
MKVVIAGGDVVDGTGTAAQPRDVFVEDGVIADVRPASDEHASWHVLDATGLTIAPGFIDVHSHADNVPFLEQDDTSKLLQGITTEVIGNCGISAAPVNPAYRDELKRILDRLMPNASFSGWSYSEYLTEADSRGYVTNYAPLVGHTTLRVAAMGAENRQADASELAMMQSLLEEALDAGAFGFSSGLIYAPGAFANTDELVSLAKCLRPNTLYTTHMRSEGALLLEAVDEALEVGRRARVRVQISHHKAAGRENWGKTADSLRAIATARANGQDVHQDVYPYTAGSTMLVALLPPEAHEGGDAAILRRLEDPEALGRFKATIESDRSSFDNFIRMAGYENILISGTASGAFEGQTLREAAAQLGVSEFEALVHILRTEQLRAAMIVFMMDEGDIKRVLSDPYTVVGTDGLPPGFGGKPHPRAFGTFPRVIAEYVRKHRVLSLEEAIRKMTSLSSDIFRIPDRGRVASGFIADLVAFDASRISDDLDYGDPVRPPVGIDWVMQQGDVVVKNGTYLGERRGKRLRPV